MMWIPKYEHEKMKALKSQRREAFIKRAQSADFGFVAMVEAMRESPEFESYPTHQKQFINDFLEARKQ